MIDQRSRAVVLGGAGFLGSHVVRRLLSLGGRVTVIDAMLPYGGANSANLASVADASGLDVIEADVCAMADLGSVFEGADLVVDAMGTTGHHWALAHPRLDLAANVTSHLAVLQALSATRARPRLVHLSSRSVYGRAQGRAVDEAHLRHPIDIHGSHKLLAERHLELSAASAGLDVTMLRIGNCYGPGQRVSGEDVGLIGGFLRDIMKGGEAVVFGGSDRRRDFLFADDLADAVIAARARGGQGVRAFNVGGASERLLDVAKHIQSAAGRGSVTMAPLPEDVARIDPGDFVLDCALAGRELGWSPKTPLSAGLALTVGYYSTRARDYGLSD